MAEPGEVVEQEMDYDAAADSIADNILPKEDAAPAADLQGEKAPEDEAATTVAAPKSTAPGAQPPASTAVGGGEAAPQPTDLPPDTLRKEAKEHWNELPGWAKQEIHKREQDFRNGYESIRETAVVGEGIGKVLEPYVPVMQQYGVNPFDHVATLLQGHATLLFGRPEQKLDVLSGLCRDAGIDLRQLVAGSQTPFVDQTVTGLQQELARLRASVSSVTGEISQQNAQKLEQEIWAFGNDEANHPDFWDVAPDMIQMFKVNPNMSLDECYKQASLANPVVRQKRIDAEVNARLDADRKRAVAARKTMGVRPRSGAPSRPASPKGFDQSLDETLQDALSDINSRS